MADTRESILITALRLFAKDGYEAVSVSMIAGELGMAKSALYKHYKNKRHIFDAIVERMCRADASRADEHDMPVEAAESAAAYGLASIGALKEFALAQFQYWTQDEFASCFRKMLTLEQYRSDEMARLFQQHLAAGPLGYTESILFAITGGRTRARRLAVRFYAPMFLMYSVYDGACDKADAAAMLRAHIDGFELDETNDKEEKS